MGDEWVDEQNAYLTENAEFVISYLKEHAPSLCSPVLCTELGDNQKVRLFERRRDKGGRTIVCRGCL